MERKVFIRKGKIAEMDRSFDLKFWQAQPPAERIAALEEIRREYHRWRYGAESRLQRVLTIIKR